MKFSQTIKLRTDELVISRRYEAWLASNDHPEYSPEALAFAARQLAARDRKRQGTFSASSLGNCLRAQQFTFLGMPKMGNLTQNAMRMSNGVFMHLRWQMAGLTEGWLKQAEVPLPANPHKLSGTMDGIVYDDSVLELKSINANGFGQIKTFGPLRGHLFQMASYLLCTERERGIFIYECKDNQEYTEIVVGRDELPLVEAGAQAQALWAGIEGQSLFEPLGKCIDRTGYVYNSCPFRDSCLEIHRWEEVDVGAE